MLLLSGFVAQALEAAEVKQRPAVKMLRACAYYRLGKFSRALSECSEVLGSGNAKLVSYADQLKGCGFKCSASTQLDLCKLLVGTFSAGDMCRECFLHEEEWDAAQEAFSSALSRSTVPNAEMTKAFVAATKAASAGEIFASSPSASWLVPVTHSPRCAGTSPINFSTLQPQSVTAEPPLVIEVKSHDPQVTAAKVAKSMARPGPSVKAEDLTEVPFAGNIELLAPKKYRCVLQHPRFICAICSQ